MRNALLIARRELGSIVRSPLGYAIVAASLLIDGLWFYVKALGAGAGPRLSADVLWTFFEGVTGTTMIASIILSFRLLAGEREVGTLVLLNTAPVRDWEIVVGKFLSVLTWIGLMTALTFYMPLLIMVNGKIAAGQIAVGYLGVLLLGSASLAIGVLASALARTQVVAAIVGALLLGIFVVLWLVARATDPPLNTFIAGLAIHHDRQRSFMTGVLKLENVVFYLAVTYFFLLAATKTLEARRWR